MRASFGAVGDGTTNDTEAFLLASQFFNNVGAINVDYSNGDKGVLIIETTQQDGITPALYRVGKQLKFGENYTVGQLTYTNTLCLLDGINLLRISNTVNGFTVKSDIDGIQARIKYVDNLYFGAFNPPGFTFHVYDIPCNGTVCTPPVAEVSFPNETSIPAYGCVQCSTQPILCDCDPDINTVKYHTQPVAIVTSTNNTQDIQPLPPSAYGYPQVDKRTLCQIRNTIVIEGAKNVTIQDIEIDGNNINSKWGSSYGDKGIQGIHYGIWLGLGDGIVAEHITINNVNVHHFDLDGLGAEGVKDVDITDSYFDYNARQGFSWTDGEDIKATNCHFDNTGMAINSLSGIQMFSDPAAGLDIEPDPGSNMKCKDGIFTLCSFANSKNCNVNNFVGENNIVYDQTKDITFNSCTFYDPDNDGGLWIQGSRYKFNNCYIYAPLTYIGWGKLPNSRTEFIGCTFEDKDYLGNTYVSNGTLMNLADNSQKALFDGCHFKITKDNNKYVFCAANYDAVTDASNYFIMKDCDFTFAQNVSTPHHLFKGIRFQGNNSFINTSALTNYAHLETQGTLIEGSLNSCDPNELSIAGHILFEGYGQWNPLLLGKNETNLLNPTNAIMRIKNGAFLYDISMYNGKGIDIGENSKLIIEEGGSMSFQCDSKIYLRGQLIADNNSHVYGGISIISNTTSNSLLYFDDNADTEISPFWESILPNYKILGGCPLTPNLTNWLDAGYTFPSGFCRQGGHQPVPTQCTNGIYSNISTNGPFTVMYNVVNAICNGGLGSLNLSIQGGQGPYQATLNSIPMGANFGNVNPLPAGTYTITITDGSGCTNNSNTFTFEITQPPALALTASSTSILCNGGTSTITANGTGGITPYQYSVNGGANQSSNTFYGNTAGTYTVTILDANGCTSSTTITISQPSILQWQTIVVNNITCGNTNNGNINVNTSGGTLPISYTINPQVGTQVGGNFTGLTENDYTITATDANGCTITTAMHLGQPVPAEHCFCQNGTNQVNTPNTIIYHDPTAQQIINVYGNNIVGKTFYISGTFTIDNDITFNGCTLWFTTNGQIFLPNSNDDFTAENNTIMQPACEWWAGILSNTANKVSILNNSTIKKSTLGLHAINNTIVMVRNSNFIDNAEHGIYLGNMTYTTYPGYIKDNTFTSTSIPTPDGKTRFGINLSSVKNITIGGLGNDEGNTFNGLRTGIWMGVGNATLNPQIKIYNNSFNNIKADYSTSVTPEADLINNCYQTYKGAAIMAYYGGPPAQNAMYVEVKNSNPASSTLAFTNCDKGIVTVQSALTAENLYMDYVPMGIMNYNIVGVNQPLGPNNFVVQKCTLRHTYLGMQFDGEKNNSSVTDNTIECDMYNSWIPDGVGFGSSYIWPKAIDISYYDNTNTADFLVLDNIVALPSSQYAGLGISVNNGGTGVSVKDNSISLANSDAYQLACGGSTTLAGIFSSTSFGTRIHRNNNIGNTGGVYLPQNIGGRVDAAGILLNHGDEQQLGCNYIIGTRFGLLGWDENNISPACSLKVQGNTIEDADAGWVFRHLVNEGTLGNVGDMSKDNNNQFVSLNTSAKVFKFCLASTFDKIFTATNTISNTESKSENLNTLLDDCPYLLQNNPGATVFDNDPNGLQCGGLQLTVDHGDITLDEALAIATNTKVYLSYPALAHWYDCKRLFRLLEEDEVFRNSHATLLSFYNAMLSDAIAQEEEADSKLRDLIEDFANYSPAQLQGEFGIAEDEIEDIDNTEIQNENDRLVNLIYLKMLRDGMDSLSQDDKQFISYLAPQCPYVGGSAVYKARTLNYLLKPGAMYDDMKICNAVGVYKQEGQNGGTKTLHQLETEALNQIKANPDFVTLDRNEFLLYPNPTESIVNIRYNCAIETELKIKDITGRIVQVSLLPSGENKMTFDLLNLANGVYTYEQIMNGKIINKGKITKQ